MFRTLALCLAGLLLSSGKSSARVWRTAYDGVWSSPLTWVGSTVPPRITGDTVLIDHYVRIDSALLMSAGALLRIDDSGAICGHHALYVQTGARLEIHGLLELDNLWVPGGYTYAGATGNIVLQYMAQWSNGGGGTSQGARWIVGPWFNCLSVIHGHPFVGVDDPATAGPPVVWRREDAVCVSIRGFSGEATLRVWDALGRIILDKQIRTGDERFPLPGPGGLLYWRLTGPGTSAGGKM